MKKITILDTSVATLNIGDEIIVDSVKRELEKLFTRNKLSMFLNIPTHEKISRYGKKIIKDSDYSFVAGTNLLSSKYKILRTNQWNIPIFEAYNLNSIILMGVGWGSYQKTPDLITKILYNRFLSKEYMHSVRDSYTLKKLEGIGIKNVINTGCPTMWELTEEHCKSIPLDKAKDVVFTLTDYSKDIESDKKLIEILKCNYSKLYFWVQGSGDYEYIQSLDKDIECINPSLSSYDELLDQHTNIDFVGTRLHAGIRAMQKKKRSVIIGIDNRAIEKHKDFNINMIKREELDFLDAYLNSRIETKINLDKQAIEAWRKQFE